MSKMTQRDAELLRRENEFLRKEVARLRQDPGEQPVLGCGDSSCCIATPSGIHTNGGCHCERPALRRALTFWKSRAVYLQAVIQLARDGDRVANFDETTAQAIKKGWL